MTDVFSPWWVAVLAVFGFLALVTAIFSLFFALGRRPKRLRALRVPAVEEADDFLLALTGAVNVPTRAGGTIELLNNGDEFFPALLEALASAQRSITFFTYIFSQGSIGDRVLDVLVDRVRSGVKVRLLLDGFGAMSVNREKVSELEAAGGTVHWYRPFHLGKLTRFHKRNHRRAIVIDGRVGFTGGASISDEWLGNAQSPEHWRDMMFRVTGPLALSVQATFSEAWSNTAGEVFTGPDFFPHLEEGPTVDGAVSRHVNLISSPSAEAHPLRKLFWLSFMAARERLYLANAYFVPDKHVRQALIDRARAGVDVRILLPNRYTDAKPIWWASRSYYTELLREGVRIFEYQPTFLHSKVLVVDTRWSVIGSANMDIRSKELNEENVLGLMDRAFAERLQEAFHADLAQSREIRLEEWRRRGYRERLLERFFVLFAEQY